MNQSAPAKAASVPCINIQSHFEVSQASRNIDKNLQGIKNAGLLFFAQKQGQHGAQKVCYCKNAYGSDLYSYCTDEAVIPRFFSPLDALGPYIPFSEEWHVGNNQTRHHGRVLTTTALESPTLICPRN